MMNEKITEKLTTIAENQPRVYDNGYTKGVRDGVASGYDRFWDGFQNFGSRTYYDKGFQYWGSEYIEPKYKIVPTSQVSYLFADNENLKALYAKDFDLGSVPKSTTWNASYYALCRDCKALEIFEDINIQPNNAVGYMFMGCTNLKKVEKLRVDENTVFNGTFHQCPSLEEVWIDGVIASKGDNNNWVSFHYSPNLKKECVLQVFGCLKDFSTTGETASIGLHEKTVSNLTDAEKAIATQKGWTISIR